jgi:hypothetical protein
MSLPFFKGRFGNIIVHIGECTSHSAKDAARYMGRIETEYDKSGHAPRGIFQEYLVFSIAGFLSACAGCRLTHYDKPISELAGVPTSKHKSIAVSNDLLLLHSPFSPPSASFCMGTRSLGLRLGWCSQLMLLLVAGIRIALCNSAFPLPLLVGLS